MSDMTGEGYGRSHKWKDMGTEQISDPSQRSTLWICDSCELIMAPWIVSRAKNPLKNCIMIWNNKK